MKWTILPSLFGMLVIIDMYNIIAVSKTFTGTDSYDNVNESDNSFLHNNSILQQPALRNAFPDSYFCGQILGGHYMFGSASSYCGGFTVRDCSAQCFYRNFTFFQCEGFLCHCYS